MESIDTFNIADIESSLPPPSLKNTRTLNSELTSSIITMNTPIKLSKKDLFLKKVSTYISQYTFTIHYMNNILSLFSNLIYPMIDKYSSVFKSIKTYMKFFKEIVSVYSSMGNEMKKRKAMIEKGKLIGEDMKRIVEGSREKIGEGLMEIAKRIKNEVIIKEEFTKYESVSGKIEEIEKKIKKMFIKIEHRKNKIIKLYEKNYMKILEAFKVKYNDNDLDDSLCNMIDFIIIEHNIIQYINKAYKKVQRFITEIKELISSMFTLISPYMTIIKQCVDIYSTCSHSSPNEELNEFYKAISSESLQSQLSPNHIISSNNKRKEMTEVLSSLQTLYIKNTQFEDNIIIYDNYRFTIDNYDTFDNLIDFLLTLIPYEIEINYTELISFKGEYLRDAGLFKGWKKCFIVITIQGHLIIFDEDKSDEKVNDVSVNKLFLVYRLNVVGIKKKESRTKKMFEIYENEKGKAKKEIVLESINENDYNSIFTEINSVTKT